MLDTLIECVKIITVHTHLNKNLRIVDFLITFTHVTHINYATNKNLSLVFDALIDSFTQVGIDDEVHSNVDFFVIDDDRHGQPNKVHNIASAEQTASVR